MIFEFSEGWIETKDSITVGALIALREGRAVKALSSCIVSWSEKEPINEYNVGRLKAHIGQKILRYLLKQYNDLLSQKEKIDSLARIVAGGYRLHANEDIELYEKLQYLAPCLGSLGGIAHFPEAGGLLDQRADLMLFLLALQQAYAESTKKGR